MVDAPHASVFKMYLDNGLIDVLLVSPEVVRLFDSMIFEGLNSSALFYSILFYSSQVKLIQFNVYWILVIFNSYSHLYQCNFPCFIFYFFNPNI